MIRNYFALWSVICAFLIFDLSGGYAQNLTINDVLKSKSRGGGEIYKDKEVMGYYSLYELEKKDKNFRNYRLDIYDQNLGLLQRKDFTEEKNINLADVAYNGANLMLKFDAPKNITIFKLIDKEGNILASHKREELDNASLFGTNTDEDVDNDALQPIDNRGFLDFSEDLSRLKSKAKYVINYFPDDKSKKGWTFKADPKAERLQTANFLAQSENTLFCLINKKKSNSSNDIEDYILAIDLETGKKKFEKSVEDKDYAVATLSSLTDENGDILLFGMYFEKDAKTAKSSSLGLCCFVMGTDGEMKSRKYITWAKDVAKFLPVNRKGKIEDIGYLFFHKFLKTNDGKIFGISEQFKKSTSNTILSNNYGNNTSTVAVSVDDFFVFEFDNVFDLKDVQLVEKTKSTHIFPYGSTGFSIMGLSYIGNRRLGLMVKATGGFDYEFTRQTADGSSFNVGYIEYDRTKEDKGFHFGSINYKDGKFNLDRIKFNKKAKTRVYPAKQGYVMIREYFKKEKKFEYRLEKINM